MEEARHRRRAPAPAFAAVSRTGGWILEDALHFASGMRKAGLLSRALGALTGPRTTPVSRPLH